MLFSDADHSGQERRHAAFLLVFYAWGDPRFLAILLFSIAFNYSAAIVIDGKTGSGRKWALAAAVAGNLLVLGIFKYANFVTANVAALMGPLGYEFGKTNIELPLGISFFTFHCLSYIIDVYRRRFRANRDPVDVALYISLFPQLVAGPIVRYKTVARQLDRRRATLGRASVGARIFIVGLAQKVLVADVVAPLVRVAFDQIPHRALAEAWIGLIAYTVQIYFDFAGYSNMAIGLGVVLGFTFPRNFRMPYTSLSITEFWRRWHMSLSSWMRDYLYIPLGGNRGTDLQTYRNLVTVFVLCGVWHGANWTFVLWGVWHGAFLVIERLGLGSILARVPAWLSWLYALLAVMGGWVLFRAADLPTALDYVASLIGPERRRRHQLRHARRPQRKGAGDVDHRLGAGRPAALAAANVGAAHPSRRSRHGLDVRASDLLDDHDRVGGLQPVPLFQVLIREMLPRYRRFFAVLSFLLLATPLVWGMVLPDSPDLILKEGRRLAAPPAAPMSWDGLRTFPKQVDAYLQDHFGLRHRMINTHKDLSHPVLMGNESVLIGRDGRMFALGNEMVRQSAGLVMRDQMVTEAADMLAAMRDALANRGIRFLVAVPPNAPTIYQDDLPIWAKSHGRRTEYDLLLDDLAARGVKAVDLRPVLKSLQSKGQEIYLKYDTHWTPRGAVAGFNAVVEADGRPDWRIDPATAVGPPQERKGGDIARLLGVQDDVSEMSEGFDLPALGDDKTLSEGRDARSHDHVRKSQARRSW